MNSADNAKEQTSDTTSSTAPANPAELGESDFLQQQADLAQEAIARTWKEITGGLGQGVSPGAWTREYPWIAVGAATVAGFFAASALIPSKEQQALRKLAALERALHPAPPVAAAAAASDNPQAQHGILHGLLGQVLKAIQPALMHAIAARMATRDGAGQNGHPEGVPPPPDFTPPPSPPPHRQSPSA
jgi:hypothetical protein